MIYVSYCVLLGLVQRVNPFLSTVLLSILLWISMLCLLSADFAAGFADNWRLWIFICRKIDNNCWEFICMRNAATGIVAF